MKWFQRPSDLVQHETDILNKYETMKKVGDYRIFHPLMGTLGWYKMEETMFGVLRQIAAEGDHWLSAVTLTEKERKTTVYCDIIGSRCFSEYFEERSEGLRLKAEPLVKIHNGIGSRKLSWYP